MTLGSYPEWSAAGESGMKKNKMDTPEYQFIKETVKKQPKENGSLLRRLLMIAGCGVLFGGCAAVTFASVFPVMADREENTQQKIELTGSDVAETISEEQATERESVASVSEQEEKSLLAMRQEMYREVLKVSQKSRKSLVNVRGISKDEDLLNNSYLQQEDTEGLVFLETETQFYILTYEEELENLQELQAGNLVETLEENTSFIGYTVNENWGLWNFNVYLNQRHLAFGLLMATLALYLFMDWLEAGTAHEEKGILWIKNRIFSKEGWKSRNLDQALLMGMFLGLCAFWNGAAVIGGLLILCGFAIFSDGKVDYAVMAGVSIFFSWLQSKIFIVGSAMSPQIYLGFLAEDKTVPGVVKYLFWMSGVFFLGLVLMVWFMRRRERAILVSFLFPVIFAFVLLMTPDINVNHKYIMISYAFLTIFWAWAVCSLWKGRNGQSGIQKTMGKILAIVLVISLSVTGIYDFVVIIKGNGPGRRVTVNMNSELTQWLEENLEKNDLLLTPEYSMNEVTMSGAMLYCGWPYYAWSAGYDTNYRAAQAVTIYTTSDSETLKKTVQQEKITYILFEEGSEFEQQECREETIAAAYEKVYETQDGRIRIYKTTE